MHLEQERLRLEGERLRLERERLEAGRRGYGRGTPPPAVPGYPYSYGAAPMSSMRGPESPDESMLPVSVVGGTLVVKTFKGFNKIKGENYQFAGYQGVQYDPQQGLFTIPMIFQNGSAQRMETIYIQVQGGAMTVTHNGRGMRVMLPRYAGQDISVPMDHLTLTFRAKPAPPPMAPQAYYPR